MFNWFFTPRMPKYDPIKYESPWPTETTFTKTDFSPDKLIVSVATDGNIEIDINKGYKLRIPGGLRHEFLKKIQNAVAMADLTDPDNKGTL